MVEEVERSKAKLLDPTILEKWIPDCNNSLTIERKLNDALLVVKKVFSQNENQEKHLELLDFIQEEILHSDSPRMYLIQSALSTLKADTASDQKEALEELEQTLNNYLIKRTNKKVRT